MPTILFAVLRMLPGWGVSVVLNALCRKLEGIGIRCVVACLETDHSFEGTEIRVVRPDVGNLRELVAEIAPMCVVAHSSPFFEYCAELADAVPCIAWEHGEPTSEFFSDSEERRCRTLGKIAVYPRFLQVVAISEFIRTDIGFPDAVVIYNGCDHAPDLGPKPMGPHLGGPESPLKVGTLMRLGTGEAQYKGNDHFIAMVDALRKEGINIAPFVAGRGEPADAKEFVERGISATLNLTDGEKWKYLRDLDVFISFSQWEGFNLPLVEAQALGTVGLAFDVGAHPETTPFVFTDVNAALTLIRRYIVDRPLLHGHSRLSYHFVRRNFRWSSTAVKFVELLKTCGLLATAATDQVTALLNRLERRNVDMIALQREFTRMSIALDAKDAQVTDLRESLSWKITMPLRRFGKVPHRLFVKHAKHGGA